MSQPVHTKSEKRKSLGASILRAISSKQGQQIKSSSAGSPSPGPELTTGKRRRATQGTTETTLRSQRSQPGSPFKARKADTPQLTGQSPARNRKMSRSASTPRDNNTISPSSAPQSTRSQDNRERFTTLDRTTTTTNTSTANSTFTQGEHTIGSALRPAAHLAKLTSPNPAQTTTLGLAQSGVPGNSAAAQFSSSGLQALGTSKQMRPCSSPSRLQSEKKKGLQENELIYAQWKLNAKKASAVHLAPYDTQTILKPYLEQVSEETKLKADLTGNDSNSSSLTLSPSNSRKRSRKLERRPSIKLSQNSYTGEAEGPPSYPPLAREWINETHYAKLPHAAKLMMLALSNLRGFHEQGRKAYGDEWVGNADSSLKLRRNEDNEAETLDGRERLENLYEKAKLAKHFDDQIKSLTLVPAGPERAGAIQKLVMQANHVLDLALESLRLLTLRTDIPAKRMPMYWEAMTAVSAKRNDIELLTAYFGNQCVTVQAFVNALTWLVKSGGHGNDADRLKSIHTLGPNFLGYPDIRFKALQLYVTISTMARELQRAGKTAEELKFNVLKMTEDHVKDVEPGDNAVQKTTSPRASGRQALYREIAEQSGTFMRLLLAGDTRFLKAAGLDSITDPPSTPPSVAPTTPSSLTKPVAPPPLSVSMPTALHASPQRRQSTIPLPTLPPSPTDFGQ